MTPEQIRKHATDIILDRARDVEFLSIAEHLINEDIADEDGTLAKTIDEAIREATVTVEWPPTPGDPVAALRALAAEAREDAGLNPSSEGRAAAAMIKVLELAADAGGTGSPVVEALAEFALIMAEDEAEAKA